MKKIEYFFKRSKLILFHKDKLWHVKMPNVKLYKLGEKIHFHYHVLVNLGADWYYVIK